MFSTYLKTLFVHLKNFYTALSTLSCAGGNSSSKVIHIVSNMTTFLGEPLIKFYGENLIDINLAMIYNRDGL
jgi:hypothetical protein